MIFDQFNFIQGQPVQEHMNIANNPFLHIPGYPNGYPTPTYPHLHVSPLDLIPINKEKLDASVKEEKKKRHRKKLLKLMLILQIMNNQK